MFCHKFIHNRLLPVILLLSWLNNAVQSGSTETSSSPFGHNMLQYFALSPNYTNFNFGSYGSPPRQVIEYQNNLRMHIEECPDCWMRYERYTAINGVQSQLAEYLGIEDWNDLVFTINASHGVNSVLRSIAEQIYNKQCSSSSKNNKNKCKFLYLSIAYSMVKNTIHHLTSDTAFNENEVGLQVNVTSQMLTNSTLLLNEIERVILAQMPQLRSKSGLTHEHSYSDNYGNPIILASFSHITSVPGVILPIKDIINLCHSYSIPVLIDGAHAMGEIFVNISDYNDVDFYLSNGHKWLYSSRGSSILYVSKKYQNLTFPTCISDEGQGNTQFQRYFSYQGTNDDTPWMSMKEALTFRNEYNDTAIIDYIHKLAVNGGKKLVSMWNTSMIGGESDTIADSVIPAMVNVVLPTQNGTEVSMIQSMLYQDYYTYVVFYEWNNVWYTRLSAQIFLEMSDFEWLGTTFLTLLDKIRKS